MADLIYTQDAITDLVTKYNCCYNTLMKKVLKQEMYALDPCISLAEALFVKKTAKILEGFTKDGAIIGYTSDATATIDLSTLVASEFVNNMYIVVTSDYAGATILAQFFWDGDGLGLTDLRDELISQINSFGSGYTAGTPSGNTFVVNVPTNLSSLPTGSTITITFPEQFFLEHKEDLTNFPGQTANNSELGWELRDGAATQTDHIYIEGATGSTSGYLYVARRFEPEEFQITHDFNGGADLNIADESTDGATVTSGTQIQTITLPVSTFSSDLFVNNTPISITATVSGTPYAITGIISDNTNLNSGPSVQITIYQTNANGVQGAVPLATGSQTWNVEIYWNHNDAPDRLVAPGVVQIYDIDATVSPSTVTLDTTLVVPGLRESAYLWYDQLNEILYLGGNSVTHSDQQGINYIDVGAAPTVLGGTSLNTARVRFGRLVGVQNQDSFASINTTGSSILQSVGLAPGDFTFTETSGITNKSPIGQNYWASDQDNNRLYYGYGREVWYLEGLGSSGSTSTLSNGYLFTPNNTLAIINGFYLAGMHYDESTSTLFVIENRENGTADYTILCSYDVSSGASVQIANSLQEYPIPSGTIFGNSVLVNAGRYLMCTLSGTEQAFFDMDSRTWVYGTLPVDKVASGHIEQLRWDNTNSKIIVASTEISTGGTDSYMDVNIYALTQNEGTLTASVSGTVTPITFDGTDNCLTEDQIQSLIELAQKYCCECANC